MRRLTSASIDNTNTFEDPNRVQAETLNIEIAGAPNAELVFPAQSLTTLRIRC